MKASNFLFGIWAMMTGLGLTGCGSEEEGMDLTPDKGYSVKTQLAISIPSVGKTGRMSGAMVQEKPENFRGLQNLTLFPFMGKYPVGGENFVTTQSQFSGVTPQMTAVGNTGLDHANSLWYPNVSLPSGVNAVLFYAEALGSKTPADEHAQKAATGVLTLTHPLSASNTTLKTTHDIHFDLCQITDHTLAELLNGKATTQEAKEQIEELLQLLNRVRAAQFTKTVEGTPTTVNWSSLVAAEGADKFYLETLVSTYKKYEGTQVGSSCNIRLLMQSLYNVVQPIVGKVAGGDADQMAQAIVDAILGTHLGTADQPVLKFTVKDGTQAPLAELEWGAKDATGCYGPVENFPNATLHLPDGALSVRYLADEQRFVYLANPNNMGIQVPKLTDYVYPPSLWYMVNSDVATAPDFKKDLLVDDDWARFVATNYKGESVETSTQSMAVKQTIDYGVGQLRASVKLKDQDILGGADGNGVAKVVIPQNEVASTQNIEWTGILLGGQKQVDMNMETVVTASEKTIYDGVMNRDAVPGKTFFVQTGGTKTNYTLALETANEADVNVALEFKNHGPEFVGKNGALIPSGGYFYLAGVLKAPQQDYGTVQRHVFKKDHYTQATFSITSLKEATNYIPDLRVAQLEVGISVNLSWKQGNKFDVGID